LDKEFLSDYAAREDEESERLSAISLSDINMAKEKYKKRFRRLNAPIARNAPYENLWPQVPIYGTLVIALSPFSTKYSSAYHGFDASDLNRLVDFAKDTGRVAFVLTEHPQEYRGLDFLDPIFTELKPPQDYAFLGHPSVQDSRSYRDAIVEFDTLSRIRFYRHIDNLISESRQEHTFGPSADPKRVIFWLRHVFAALVILDYDELKQIASDAIIEDPRAAFDLLGVLDLLVVRPRTDPLDAVSNIGRDVLEQSPGLSRLTTVDLPLQASQTVRERIHTPELGQFLMKKLAPYPESFEACRAMCDRYDHFELHQIMNSLQQAVMSENYSKMGCGTRDLSEALDKIWLDAKKFEDKARMVRAGLMIGPAVLGAVAAGPVAFVGGLLAGLGYTITEKILELETDSISERIAKSLTPNYLVNIFDFKKKHRLIE
jgi:hypothetical protein